MCGVGLVLGRLRCSEFADVEQMQGSLGMLHPCTESGNKVDLERVWSVVRAANVKWTPCGARLLLGRFRSS